MCGTEAKTRAGTIKSRPTNLKTCNSSMTSPRADSGPWRLWRSPVDLTGEAARSRGRQRSAARPEANLTAGAAPSWGHPCMVRNQVDGEARAWS